MARRHRRMGLATAGQARSASDHRAISYARPSPGELSAFQQQAGSYLRLATPRLARLFAPCHARRGALTTAVVAASKEKGSRNGCPSRSEIELKLTAPKCASMCRPGTAFPSGRAHSWRSRYSGIPWSWPLRLGEPGCTSPWLPLCRRLS